jgi:hypothetical protein
MRSCSGRMRGEAGGKQRRAAEYQISRPHARRPGRPTQYSQPADTIEAIGPCVTLSSGTKSNAGNARGTKIALIITVTARHGCDCR